jgi:hypothetical protein
MVIGRYAHAVSPVQGTRNCGWIIADCGILAAIALVALYFCLPAPDFTQSFAAGSWTAQPIAGSGNVV